MTRTHHAFLIAALAVAGCKGTDTFVCSPQCPNGSHCAESGCVSDSAGNRPDMAAQGHDMANSCPMPCTGTTPLCNASHQCVPCLADTDCQPGQVCKASGATTACVPGCADDSRCAQGQKCCGGQCVNTATDPQNCGACGTACGVQHSSALCAAGACKPGTCDPGWGDCNGSAKDGCETNTRIDTNNCTACGTKCAFPHGTPACSDGCYVAACDFGWADCNNDMDNKDGCEKSVIADPLNCGDCGARCNNMVPHAKNACINAACQLTSCDQGYADCDGKQANGCEVAIGTDVMNCGQCGNTCAQGLACVNSSCTCKQCNIPGAKTMCVNNQCVFAGCLPGYADCDNNQGNGCEINTGNDPKNCGACGSVCPKNTPSCGSGQCVMGFDFGPSHTFTGLTSTHYITQGGCSVGGNPAIDADAAYFCLHFYGQPLNLNCVPVAGYVAGRTPNCNDAKMHKNGGCTGNGNNVPNTMCDNGPCKIGDWVECTSGITNLVCHCQ